MKIGFTGTRNGMTEAQKGKIRELLIKMIPYQGGKGPVAVKEVRHGKCVGADEQFNDMARSYQYFAYGYPASDVDARYVSDCTVDKLMPAMPALERNHVIVDESEVMLATPGQAYEVLRSGTWSAIRYAFQICKPICIVYPDGTLGGTYNALAT